jgi:hypothetical protein
MNEFNNTLYLSDFKKDMPDRKEKYNRYAFDFIRRLQELREIEFTRVKSIGSM